MRITTAMLNQTARKTGIPIGTGSLLDYVNMDGESAIAKALNKTPANAQNMVMKSKYEALGNEAKALYDQMQKLSAKGEDNLFGKAKESGDNSKIYDAIAGMAEKYNDTMKTLKAAGGALNNYYTQMLGLAAKDKEEELADIGVSIAKDGKLSFDKEKVKVTDPDEIAKIIGAEGSVGEKVAFIAGKVVDNAEVNIQSVSNQYNASGNLYANKASKYDFLG